MAASSAPTHSRSHTPLTSLPLRAAIADITLYQGDELFTPVAEKTGGTALGTIYQLGEDTRRWMGKVGHPKGALRDDPSTIRTRTLKEMNLDTIQEKIAADFFALFSKLLGKEAYKTPKTCLSRQPVMDPFTMGNFLAAAWVHNGITQTLRIMSQFVEGYQDFSEAKALLGGEEVTFVQFIERQHRPPDHLLTPQGELVPLLGLMELLAACRLLSDTDCLGGSGKNAGFIWEYNSHGTITAARAVKIDPGCAFQFTEDENRVTTTLEERGGRRYWLLDLRDLQAANQSTSVTLLWSSLTLPQKEIFLDALQTLLDNLTDEDLLFCLTREGAFSRTPTEQIPPEIATQLHQKMQHWIALQRQIYRADLASRQAQYSVLPASFSSHFIGRADLLLALQEALIPPLGPPSGPTRPTSYCVLVGDKGIGKTTLARTFAHRHRHAFSLIYWVQAGSPDTLLASYRSLAAALGIDPQDLSLDPLRAQVHTALENKRRPWLLLIDNASSPIPFPSTGGSILLTTSSRDRFPPSHTLEVPPLSLEASIELLEQSFPATPALRTLAELSEGHPTVLFRLITTLQKKRLTPEKALETGEASYILGKLYYQGEGKDPSRSKALSALQVAARKDHPQAQFFLGTLYEQGYEQEEGLPPITPEAARAQATEWIQRAAWQGHVQAQNTLRMQEALQTSLLELDHLRLDQGQLRERLSQAEFESQQLRTRLHQSDEERQLFTYFQEALSTAERRFEESQQQLKASQEENERLRSQARRHEAEREPRSGSSSTPVTASPLPAPPSPLESGSPSLRAASPSPPALRVADTLAGLALSPSRTASPIAPRLSPPALPAIAFGADQWRRYFGDVGAQPPLPADIHSILQSSCPFWPDKRVEETHLLVLIPQTVNAVPLTMQSLGELVKSPREGVRTQYRYFFLGDYRDPPAAASHWVLMTKDVLPGSRDKSYADQQALVARHAGYQVPSLLDATVCIFMEHVRSGTRLYSDSPWTYTRCQEKYNKDWQLAVGGFAGGGLSVGYCRGSVRDVVGVGALQMF